MSSRLPTNYIIQHLSQLAEHDKEDVFNYIEQGIYYLGKSSIKTTGSKNHDRLGYFKVNKGDHILFRYEVLGYLGKGSFGLVLSAYDHKLKINVAIKIMRKAKKSVMKERFFNELTVYDYLSMCYTTEIPELSQMLGNFIFRGYHGIVLKKCHRDLFDELQKNGFNGFRLEKVKQIVQSILKGLKYLHSVNLIHGDIKLDNIAFTSKNSSNVTLLDLGNCKFDHQEFMGYDQCRFYRAPEGILRLAQGPGIDVWGLGCAAFELATGKILFRGRNDDDQLACIMKVLGVPPKNLIMKSSVADKYFYDNGLPKYCYIKCGTTYYPRGEIQNVSLRQSLPRSRDPFVTLRKKSPLFVNFIKHCLLWDVHKRITVSEALSHKWLLDKKVRSIQKCSSVKTIQKSISSHSILNRPICNLFQKSNKKLPEKLRKILSSMDCNNRKLDARAQWHLLHSKYLRKNYK